MENYAKIIEFLNSSDPETIIIGLQYLKEVNIEIPKEVFKYYKNNNVKDICNELVYAIIHHYDSLYWRVLLDEMIINIIKFSPASCACNFFEYKFKLSNEYNI